MQDRKRHLKEKGKDELDQQPKGSEQGKFHLERTDPTKISRRQIIL